MAVTVRLMLPFACVQVVLTSVVSVICGALLLVIAKLIVCVQAASSVTVTLYTLANRLLQVLVVLKLSCHV